MCVNKYYTYTYTLNKMEFVLVNLNTLTRKQLQTYAKQNGVKANGKTIIMLEQLQQIQNEMKVEEPEKTNVNNGKSTENKDEHEMNGGVNIMMEEEKSEKMETVVAKEEEQEAIVQEKIAIEEDGTVENNVEETSIVMEKNVENVIVNNVTKVEPTTSKVVEKVIIATKESTTTVIVKKKESVLLPSKKSTSSAVADIIISKTNHIAIKKKDVIVKKKKKIVNITKKKNTTMKTKHKKFGFGCSSKTNRKPLSNVSGNTSRHVTNYQPATKNNKKKRVAVKMAISARGAEQMERFLKRQRLAREKRLQKKNTVAEFSRA